MPEIPTLPETGVANFVMESWSGIFLPAKSPKAAIDRMRKEMAIMMQSPDMHARIRRIGQEPLILSAEDTEKFVQTEIKRWSKLLRDINLSE